jgi:hypothetical protein
MLSSVTSIPMTELDTDLFHFDNTSISADSRYASATA